MKQTALVLQGGGALGAYQFGAIKYLYEADPGFEPAIVTGVSIGSINAAVMLGGEQGPVASLQRMWSTLKIPTALFLPQQWQAKVSKLGNPSMYCINPSYMLSPMTAESIYSLLPFQEYLKKHINFEKLNNSPTEVVVESVNVESGQLERFSNHQGGGLTLEKVVSSMSIPPNFPAVKVHDNYYWDGGLYANMPLAPAINHLESIGDEHTERALIVLSLFRKNAVMPKNISEISDRIKELMFESKMTVDQQLFRKMDSYIDLIQAIDKELPASSKLRGSAAYQELIGHKKINCMTHLQYRAEGVEGTDDFTPNMVNFRISKGYRDAKQAFMPSDFVAEEA